MQWSPHQFFLIVLTMNIYQMLTNGLEDREVDHLPIDPTDTPAILENFSANNQLICPF